MLFGFIPLATNVDPDQLEQPCHAILTGSTLFTLSCGYLNVFKKYLGYSTFMFNNMKCY